MIAIDTNILVYAHRADSPFHRAADRCITELAESGAAFAIPWPCLHEFFAIVTHQKIYRPPTPIADALQQIDYWLEAPALSLLSETEGYWPMLRDMIATRKVAGPLVHDARVAALCRQQRISALWSADRDFSRFPGLPVINPLE